MAPRRGGGGSIGGGDIDVTVNDGLGMDNFLDYILLTHSEDTISNVLIACGSILLIASVVASVLLIWRSWRNANGKRNKTRFTLFALCLLMVAIGRTILIIDYADLLQSDEYYDSVLAHQRSTIRTDLFKIFSWAADTLLFSLILIIRIAFKSGLSPASAWYIILLILTALVGLTAAAIGLHATLFEPSPYITLGIEADVQHYNTLLQLAAGIRATLIAYRVLAFLFAVAIFNWKISPSSYNISNLHRRCLKLFLWALLFGQTLAVPGPFVLYFTKGFYAQVVSLSLQATGDLVWAVKVISMTVMAWEAHSSYQKE